jgi:ABC-type glycerol-3-phosphate transport system permease component
MVNAETITDSDVTNAGKYFVYALFIALGTIIGILIIIALAGYIIEKFHLGGMFGH